MSALRARAGAFVLANVLLAFIHSMYGLLFTAFAGISEFPCGFTNWRPMVWILEKARFRREGAPRDAQPV